MKIANRLAIVSSLLLAAGCAHHDKYSRYNESNPSYSSSTTITAPSGAATEQSTTPSTGVGASAQSSTTIPSQGFSSDTDRSLTTQVQQSLYNDPTLAVIAPSIQITAQSGTLTLTGNVKDEQQKQRIESMVKNTTGVVTVNNQLQVSSRTELTPTGETTSGKYSSTDTERLGTTAATQPAPTEKNSSLFSSSTANQAGLGLSAGTTNSLFGTNQFGISGSLQPPSPTSEPGASSRIYSTNQTGTDFSGSATNNFGFGARVQGITEADKTLGRQIMQQLRSDSSLLASLPMVRMSIDNGKVTLTGTVNSEQDKKSIETAVQGISGVATVDNQLQVKGSTGTESGTSPSSTPTPTPNPNPNP